MKNVFLSAALAIGLLTSTSAHSQADKSGQPSGSELYASVLILQNVCGYRVPAYLVQRARLRLVDEGILFPDLFEMQLIMNLVAQVQTGELTNLEALCNEAVEIARKELD